MTSRTERTRAERLESLLSKHAGWERRTLADLRTAGFNFRTVEKAKQTLRAQQKLARMSADDVLDLVAVRRAS